MSVISVGKNGECSRTVGEPKAEHRTTEVEPESKIESKPKVPPRLEAVEEAEELIQPEKRDAIDEVTEQFEVSDI